MKKLHQRLEKHWHAMFLSGHVGYFGMVFLEGHGAYAMIAGAMALMVALGAVFHLGE